jgi:hypothetical protein
MVVIKKIKKYFRSIKILLKQVIIISVIPLLIIQLIATTRPNIGETFSMHKGKIDIIMEKKKMIIVRPE